MAPVFVLDREPVASWGRTHGDRLPAATVRLPDYDPRRYQPMLCTRIRVRGEHRLADYDSGLTCPRSLDVHGPVGPGDTIRFHYDLGSHPRLGSEVLGRA